MRDSKLLLKHLSGEEHSVIKPAASTISNDVGLLFFLNTEAVYSVYYLSLQQKASMEEFNRKE